MKTRGWDVGRFKRLTFIDQHLFWTGEIRRGQIREAFDVSEDTARGDIRYYRQNFAEDLARSEGDSVYRVGVDFSTRIDPPDPESWLNRMAGDQAPLPTPLDGPYRLSNDPEVDAPPLIERRRIEPICLQSLIRAVNANEELQIIYQSPHDPELNEFWFYPHAFCSDSFRWACRGWRYDFGRWGEIVIDRIQDIGTHRPANRDEIGEDRDWNEKFMVRLAPNPGLDIHHQTAIRAQYQMDGNELKIALRRSQLVYFLKRYQLEEPVTQKAPHQAPLVIVNRDEVTAALPPRMRVPPEEEGP